MRLLSQLHTVMLFPMARVIVELQSRVQQVKSLGKGSICHFERPYAGQPIMLLALYQKGALRPDLKRMLRVAKAQGLYILAVNTLTLKQPEALQELVDCYIERPNFGRDFGSFRTGFLHVFRQKWHKSCPRVLMINDSVYYSSRGLEKFLRDMMGTQSEVLGATENYEIEYHLGSFCISMAQTVVNAPSFQRYWTSYRLTDVRPIVIKQGEMKLSKTLKRCISAPDQIRALYGTNWFLTKLKSSPDLQGLLLEDSRTSSSILWPRFDISKVTKSLAGRVIVPYYSTAANIEVTTDTPLNEMHEDALITTRAELANYLLRHVPDGAQTENFDAILTDALTAVASEVFMTGSQIHQNAAILLELGLPIIKLDGLYRGAFNNYDLLRLQRKLDPDEAQELSALLLDRPFGAQMLQGWKRAAFMRGLI